MPLVAPVDLFTDVLQTLGVQGAAQSAPNAEDAELVRRIWNKTAGQWATRQRFSSFIQEQAFPFVTAKASYTIGAAANVPAPDFAVTTGNAPANLQPGAQIVMTGLSGPNVQLQLAVINADQWQFVSIPNLPATFPNTIYYIRPGGGSPNGTIRPWPSFPTATSYQLDLSWWNQTIPILAADITTNVFLPDGCEEALMLTIAEKAYLRFPKRTDLAELKAQASKARADYQSPNVPPPKISTDGGAAQGKASGFNWLTRLPG